METTAQTITAATEPAVAARAFFRYCRDNGVKVWASNGYDEVTGWVLDVTRARVTIQDSTSGTLTTWPLADVMETVEAA